MPLIGQARFVFCTFHVLPSSALCSTKLPGRPATHTCDPLTSTHLKSQLASVAGESPRLAKPHFFPLSGLIMTRPPSPTAKAFAPVPSLTP